MFDFEYKSSVIVMRSHFHLACCIDNNKGKCTLFHCVSLCVGLQTRDLVPYLSKRIQIKFQGKYSLTNILNLTKKARFVALTLDLLFSDLLQPAKKLVQHVENYFSKKIPLINIPFYVVKTFQTFNVKHKKIFTRKVPSPTYVLYFIKKT